MALNAYHETMHDYMLKGVYLVVLYQLEKGINLRNLLHICKHC